MALCESDGASPQAARELRADAPEAAPPSRRATAAERGEHELRAVRLVPEDRDALRAHVLRLSVADRRLRFGGDLDDGAIRRYVDAIDLDHDVVLAERAACGAVIGIAELRATREQPEVREIAFSVDPERRGRGCATRLAASAVATARQLRFRRLHALCVPANKGMLDILARAGFAVERRGADIVTSLVLEPDPPPFVVARPERAATEPNAAARSSAR
jgi:RimJ/RimL family protein N-acetyltransferase